MVTCRACPRLVEWRELVAVEKRASYRDDVYWGRPIPGFGDPDAEIVVLGLAPAAHGANRTGRVFTGDRSGDWLFRAMHRAGLANQPTSVSIDDGLRLTNAWVTAAVKCAPPDNKPLAGRARHVRAVPRARVRRDWRTRAVVVCLGAFGYDAACRHFGVRPRPKFGHGVEVDVTGPGGQPITLLCSFHPSQQNTFTERLTEPMLDSVFARAVELAPVRDRPARQRRAWMRASAATAWATRASDRRSCMREEAVDLPGEVHVRRHDAGRAQPFGVGHPLVTQRIETRRDHQRRRARRERLVAGQEGRHLCVVGTALSAADVLVDEPLHARGGEAVGAVAVLRVRRGAQSGIGDGVHEDLEPDRCGREVADHRGEVSAGRVAADRQAGGIDAEGRRVLVRPLRRPRRSRRGRPGTGPPAPAGIRR